MYKFLTNAFWEEEKAWRNGNFGVSLWQKKEK